MANKSLSHFYGQAVVDACEDVVNYSGACYILLNKG